MGLIETIAENIYSIWTVPAVVGLFLTTYLYEHLVTFAAIRDIPAPSLAGWTNMWLLGVCRRGNRYEVVDKVHKRLGKVVRIQPNHVSIADEEAINAIYGHGNGFLKRCVLPQTTSISVRPSIFN